MHVRVPKGIFGWIDLLFSIDISGPWGLPVIGDVTHLDMITAKEVKRLSEIYGSVFRWVKRSILHSTLKFPDQGLPEIGTIMKF